MAHLRQGQREGRFPLIDFAERASLLATARALIPLSLKMTPAVAALLHGVSADKSRSVEEVRAAILRGEDPLGTALCSLRTAEERRLMGAIYTPASVVDSMIGWAAQQEHPVQIVDPGSGSGRFLLKAGRRFPSAKLVAIDTDPFALLLLTAGAAVLGMTDRVSSFCEDYRKVQLPPISGRTLYLGNPPYVRHHAIDPASKEWFGRTAAAIGIKASKLAGLHIHFFLRTRELAKKGDYGAFITSSEWLDVNYGSSLRAMLANGLGGIGVHLLAPDTMPFEATTTGAITTFHIGNRGETLRMRALSSLAELGNLEGGHQISWKVAEVAPRWTILTRGTPQPSPGFSELGEVFSVHRGQVTGANRIWVAGAYSGPLPDFVLKRTITRARELIAAGDELGPDAIARLKYVIDLPISLDQLDRGEKDEIQHFLTWARKAGAPDGYVASHRKAWWSVGLRSPAPILCTYMARRPPAFVYNPHKAWHINIAHGLYPRDQIDAPTLKAYVKALSASVVVSDGRTYAGGLTKFEPGEVERLHVPQPGTLSHGQA